MGLLGGPATDMVGLVVTRRCTISAAAISDSQDVGQLGMELLTSTESLRRM